MTEPGRRERMRRAIVILPGAFTAGNLFFGIWAIVEAARGDLRRAAWFIVAAGVMDVLDGRIARMSRTGTQFGAELDSLVDAISFGVAPAMLLYFLQFKNGEWAWVLCFLYVLCAVLRLARFNIEQAGHAKSQFYGLPSPSAGITLATFYPFSQTPLFTKYLVDLWHWPVALAMLMMLTGLLMVSHVPYPLLPRMGLRTARGLLGTATMLGALAAGLYVPEYFFFLYGIGYIAYGLIRAVATGFLDRLPERDPLREEDLDGQRPLEQPGGAMHPRFRLGGRRRGSGT